MRRSLISGREGGGIPADFRAYGRSRVPAGLCGIDGGSPPGHCRLDQRQAGMKSTEMGERRGDGEARRLGSGHKNVAMNGPRTPPREGWRAQAAGVEGRKDIRCAVGLIGGYLAGTIFCMAAMYLTIPSVGVAGAAFPAMFGSVVLGAVYLLRVYFLLNRFLLGIIVAAFCYACYFGLAVL